MASGRKGTERRHNPVESICRKIRAIQKREELSNQSQQITKYQSSSFDSPQANTRKDFEGILKKMAAAHIPTPNTHFSAPEKDDALISSPQTGSPRTLSVSQLSSPENATYSILKSSENISRLRSQSSQNYGSLVSQTRKRESFSNKDLNNYGNENHFSILRLDFDSTSDQSSEIFTPQDSVGKNWSLKEDGWKLDTDDGINRTCEEFFTSVFHACDTNCRVKMITNITESASGNFKALGRDVSRGILEVSDLITCVEELHFNKQKLEEDNSQLKLALETLEEANSRLSEDCTELRLQIKSAHQALMRTNLLQEELEELKTSMSASEEQKTTIVAQNKQLMELHMYENILLNKDASLQKKDLSIEELKSTIIEYGSIIEVFHNNLRTRKNLRGEKTKLAHELQHLQQELIMNGIQLNVSEEHKSIISKGEKSLRCELILAQSAENTEIEQQCSLISLSSLDTMMDQEMLLSLRELEQEGVGSTATLQKLHEDVSEVEALIDSPLQWVTSPEITVKEKWENMLTEFKYTMEEKLNFCILMLKNLGNHKESLDKEFVKLIEILKRFGLEYFYFGKEYLSRQKQLEAIKQLQEDAVDQEAILRKKVQGASQRIEDAEEQENGIERLTPESLPQSRDYPTLSSPGPTSSTESTVTSSETLNKASGYLACKSFCEKKKDRRSDSAMIKVKDASPAHENIALQSSVNENKTMLNLEAKEETKTINEPRKECVAGDAAVSSPPVTTVKSVNFKQSDNTSANEKEVEAEFLRLSLGFKCDWFTLEKRLKLEERTRDLAEENLKKEITNCVKLLELLTPLCEDDNQAQEIIKKLENSITFLSQCTLRVASRAEMLGAINQESRVSKAVEVMIQHVENLKRMYAKEHAELEELKQVLLQNERSFNPLEDEDDCQVKKRSASLNSKVAGMENNDRFSRRSSSWRILGSKQSEHRPSLQRFISTYSWADGEEEKCELKTKDDAEPPGEETVERTRKPSLSEKRNNPSKWDVSSIYDTIASWATNLKTSIRKANKALWLSVALIVLFAALISFLTGRFFQKSVDAAPTQDGDSWMSLEHILWPFTKLRHNGPPPV
ncbi:Lymphoid-restricted membrane protein [Myotis davidii]|uniref:Lymphoid-restricted membrane protein n=1 Tax=Myotis davidii TaxID=225400 RepID=L5LES4_MYODS|nr:Lymphoid-restricted membrane protein [Myotis davidii]